MTASFSDGGEWRYGMQTRRRRGGGSGKELTAVAVRVSAGSGKGWRRCAVAGDLGGREVEDDAMVMVRCVRRPAGRPGGVGDGGGAFTQHGKARGGRGARWFTAALPWPRRPSRGKSEAEKGMDAREREGARGSAWRLLGVEEEPGRLGGRRWPRRMPKSGDHTPSCLLAGG